MQHNVWFKQDLKKYLPMKSMPSLSTPSGVSGMLKGIPQPPFCPSLTGRRSCPCSAAVPAARLSNPSGEYVCLSSSLSLERSGRMRFGSMIVSNRSVMESVSRKSSSSKVGRGGRISGRQALCGRDGGGTSGGCCSEPPLDNFTELDFILSPVKKKRPLKY